MVFLIVYNILIVSCSPQFGSQETRNRVQSSPHMLCHFCHYCEKTFTKRQKENNNLKRDVSSWIFGSYLLACSRFILWIIWSGASSSIFLLLFFYFAKREKGNLFIISARHFFFVSCLIYFSCSLPVAFIARNKTGTRDEFRLMFGSVLTFPSGSSSRWALELSIVCCERQ